VYRRTLAVLVAISAVMLILAGSVSAETARGGNVQRTDHIRHELERARHLLGVEKDCAGAWDVHWSLIQGPDWLWGIAGLSLNTYFLHAPLTPPSFVDDGESRWRYQNVILLNHYAAAESGYYDGVFSGGFGAMKRDDFERYFWVIFRRARISAPADVAGRFRNAFQGEEASVCTPGRGRPADCLASLVTHRVLPNLDTFVSGINEELSKAGGSGATCVPGALD